MLSKALIQKNKKQLLSEKERLQKLLLGIGSDYPELGTQEDENAAEVAMYERNVVEGRDLRERLRQVEAALMRIRDGRYGVCIRGGEEMDEARLLAAPEAENCVAHAEK